MDLSVVIVHYRTPELVCEAVEALEPALAGLSSECLIVDNGSDDGDAKRFAQLPARRIDPGGNLGYAGGINLGVKSARGDNVIAMNPDVLVDSGCIERLLEQIESGYHVAGPRFFLDRQRRLLIPPTELRTRSRELIGAVARRSRRAAGWARRLWRAHARSHWLAEEPLPSWSLSGALLAFRREAWERIGPFDEGYRLYFEESDWLERARADGLRAVYVPAATAVHLYDQAAKTQQSSRRWFAESALRYRRRYLGRALSALILRLESSDRAGSAVEPAFLAPTAADELGAPPSFFGDSGGWLELSLERCGFPAVSERCEAGSAWLPPDGLASSGGSVFWARWVDAHGAELPLERPLRL